VANTLVARKEMLKEYFSICITDDGKLSAIPLMVKGYVPNLEKLSDFLWRLGSEVRKNTFGDLFNTLFLNFAVLDY
jgi:DNA mismatch repair protein MLH1